MAKICRICMSEESDNSNMRNLFEPFSQDIISMIEYCTGVLLQNDHKLPSQMCIKCLDDLHVAHKFKMRCIDLERAFEELIKCSNTDIKTEAQLDSNCGSIKSESCVDDDNMSIDTKVVNEDDTSIRIPIKNKPLRNKKEKKCARSSVYNETKIKSRKGLNKFRKLYCEQCQMAFSNRKESMEHKKKLHKEEKIWICEVCGKSYAHRSSQIAHKHSHYGVRYRCHHCDYYTHNKSDLVKHVRVHTGDKFYKCTQCPAAYRTSSNLRTHVRLRHERKRAHACHICGNKYFDRVTLNRHIDAHNDIKRHVCEVCHSCFARRYDWKKHLQKQHDIVIPSCRPGRQKTEVVLLERSENVT